MIEPGYYPARAIQHTTDDGEKLFVELGESKNGIMQCLVSFRITEGEAKGQILSWYGSFSENAYERTMQSLRFCGWEGDDLNDISDLPNEVSVTVEHNEWDGKVNARIAWVNQPGGGARMNNPLSKNRARQFAAQMKARAQAVGGGARRTQAATSSGGGGGRSAPPDDSDDIPFVFDQWPSRDRL